MDETETSRKTTALSENASSSRAVDFEKLTGITERERFLLELEFVQSLSSPQYLQCPFCFLLPQMIAIEGLSQTGWFEKSGSVEFLKYLLYWKQPKYAKYIM